jgi:acyl-CoA thioesterase-1
MLHDTSRRTGRRFHWWSLLLLLTVAGCSVREAACGRPAEEVPVLSEMQEAAILGDELPLVQVAILGDSLTAGYGLLQNEAFPQRLADEFETDGYTNIEVVNAGVSGDTTSGGLARLEWVLEPAVRVLVVALGGNDALRGVPPSTTRDNLAKIIATAKEQGVMVVLCGMEAPPNLGDDYRMAFRSIFPQLAAEYDVPLVPFLLEGVAGMPALNQADGIHPTAEGQRMIAALVYPRLKPVVDDILSR